MSGDYRTSDSPEAFVTMVEVDPHRHFMVVRFKDPEWKTLVLQRELRPEFWVSKRECVGNIEPARAVTGLLLGSDAFDTLSLLKKEVRVERRANSILRDELARLQTQMAAMKAAGKRGGKRGRRNS